MSEHQEWRPRRQYWKVIVSGSLGMLSLASAYSGGVYSPLLFGGLALVSLFGWRTFASVLGMGLLAVKDSVLLREVANPFSWFAIAEVKNGGEDLSRALSSFSGILIIEAHTGRSYTIMHTFALNLRSAESSIVNQFREAAVSMRNGGAYLLPLDSTTASRVFTSRLSAVKVGAHSTKVADVLVLSCGAGFVRRIGPYIKATSRASGAFVPAPFARLRNEPLTWEVLDSLEDRVRWAQADGYSNLLHTFASAAGEPLFQRIGEIEGDGDTLAVTPLAGEKVRLSRPQLRAIVATYR